MGISAFLGGVDTSDELMELVYSEKAVCARYTHV